MTIRWFTRRRASANSFSWCANSSCGDLILYLRRGALFGLGAHLLGDLRRMRRQRARGRGLVRVGQSARRLFLACDYSPSRLVRQHAVEHAADVVGDRPAELPGALIDRREPLTELREYSGKRLAGGAALPHVLLEAAGEALMHARGDVAVRLCAEPFAHRLGIVLERLRCERVRGVGEEIFEPQMPGLVNEGRSVGVFEESNGGPRLLRREPDFAALGLLELALRSYIWRAALAPRVEGRLALGRGDVWSRAPPEQFLIAKI